MDDRFYLEHNLVEVKRRLEEARTAYELTGQSLYKKRMETWSNEIKWFEQRIAKLPKPEAVTA